ncbi:MerR family transcriptional regulator [Clostridium cylindrosporum]|uniref:Regulatory protein MerR n=1 Tax=Clostridium cylindrosporum DSM 605 TaxID=1121307 RepID=A0A0J8D758_CLOCY|nr:MerR family transcriptional regulator [Clostridium cylindrosporum]KMT21727.1 regulatory protein MerR [Clostridium cylindrosporum DSM 605]
MEKNIYSFKEACNKTGYKASAIRYYEKEFYLNIPRDNNSRRVFTKKELDTLFFIKDLQEKGYSNTQIKKLMENEEVREEIAATTGSLEVDFVKGLEEKLQEINKSLCELSENVSSKERDLIISENMKLKMENKQKAYEIIQLKEKLKYESNKKQGFFSRIFGKK